MDDALRGATRGAMDKLQQLQLQADNVSESIGTWASAALGNSTLLHPLPTPDSLGVHYQTAGAGEGPCRSAAEEGERRDVSGVEENGTELARAPLVREADACSGGESGAAVLPVSTFKDLATGSFKDGIQWSRRRVSDEEADARGSAGGPCVVQQLEDGGGGARGRRKGIGTKEERVEEGSVLESQVEQQASMLQDCMR